MEESDQTINGEYYQNFIEFIDVIIDSINQYKTISYKQFCGIMIDELKIQGNKKGLVNKEVLKKFWAGRKKDIILSWVDKTITGDMMDELFRHPTRGKDFPMFEYFVKKYKMQHDRNEVIMFNNNYHFDKNVRKEALFVNVILRNIAKHPILGKFLNKIEYQLQYSFRRSTLVKSGTKLYDIAFPKLGIIIEIDENHTDAESTNDAIKDSYVRINGMIIFRLSLKSFIPQHVVRRDDMVLNVDILSKFLDDLLSMMQAALFSYDINAINKFIVDKCKERVNELKDKVSEYKEDLEKSLKIYNKKVAKYPKSTKINFYKKEISILEKNLKESNKLLNILSNIGSEHISDINTIGFDEYFSLKYNFENFGTLIPANILIDLQLFKETNKSELKRILVLHNIIDLISDDLEIKNIELTWDQFRFVVTFVDHSDIISKKRTIFYLNIVEEYFGYLHKEIKRYTDAIRSTEEDAQRVIDFVEENTARSLTKELFTLRIKVKSVDKLKKDLNFKQKIIDTKDVLLQEKEQYLKQKDKKIAELEKLLQRATIVDSESDYVSDSD
ncbi:MAG: hypothetical protein ACRCZI_12500 [Cetobacterium sp.]